MIVTEEIRIQSNKKKLLILILLAGMFVLIGIYILVVESSKGFTLIQGICLLSIALFGWGGIVGVSKILDKKPGLILNNLGITDNSSVNAVGFIPWSDILSISVILVEREQLLFVYVKEPQQYIEVGSAARRGLKRINYKMYGSPISISSSFLQVKNFTEMMTIFLRYLSDYGNDDVEILGNWGDV
jgi:hypothetical protein